MQLFGTSLLALVVVTGCGACYFPIELQGHFLMQSTASADVQYSPVSINAEAIPIWGHCHRRIGDDVILMDSSGGANCIRCFQVRLRSRNVLQVHTEGLDKCYTSEDAAEASCPGENSKEILLYKTMDHNEEPIVPEYCPFNGRFTFTYNTNDASEGSLECPVPMSELDTCPSGSFLNLRYHGCSFEDYNVTYQCLGHWEGPSNQTYLALLHPGRHQYHCALFRENPDGSILLAFSSDSTCRSDLRSATSGYEMFSLAPVKQKEWPVIARDTICRFPKSIQGNWQHVTVHDNTFIYKDFSSMKTYTAKCIDVPPPPDKYPVYARSQCGEEMYSCLWIKSRGINVMEYQVGQQSSPTYKNSLCAESNFKDKSWTTQGKMERVQEMACPILGEYVGYIPDIMGLCAKLSSDCKSPEIMYYTVSNCTAPDIYEGIHQRRRKIRQTGGRIYQISSPQPSITLNPEMKPFNDTNTAKPIYTNYRTDLYKSTITSNSPPQSPLQDFEEEYDPWDFAKTHGNLNPIKATNINVAYSSRDVPSRNPEGNNQHSTTTFENSHIQPENTRRTINSQEARSMTRDYEYQYRQGGERNNKPTWNPFYETRNGYYNDPTPSTTITFPTISKHQFTTVDERHRDNWMKNIDSGSNFYSNNRQYNNNGYPGQINVASKDETYNLEHSLPHRSTFASTDRDSNPYGRSVYLENTYSKDLNVNRHSLIFQSPFSSITNMSSQSNNRNNGWNTTNQHDNHHKIQDSNDQHTTVTSIYSREHKPNNYYSEQVPYDRTISTTNTYSRRHNPSSGTYNNPSESVARDRQTIQPTIYHGANQYDSVLYSYTTYNRKGEVANNTNGNLNGGNNTPGSVPPHHVSKPFPNRNQQWSGGSIIKEIPNTNDGWHGPINIPVTRYIGHYPSSRSSGSRPSWHQAQPSYAPMVVNRRRFAAHKLKEREYRCLGQWEEDGLMFTFTQRRDVGTYECFVGTITSTDEIYIQEAGDNCQRNMNPLHHGMKLSKTGSCFSGQPNPTYHTYQTTSRTTNRYTPEPTKPWKPITAPPKTYNGNSLASLPGITVIISIPLVLVILETIM